ncbi:MAG TPA: beta-galactosidase [Gaiellaceae bacterium]
MPRLGVAYYPEQWPRERWEQDAELMVEAGLSVVRIAEFAWAGLEPSPGTFQFDWLDDAIGVLAARGLSVLLGTPTAAPPVWLVEAHPEILPLRPDGRVHRFGHRRHYCPNQPAMQDATVRVVAALADRYGHDARIEGWQIDNELMGRCVCDACRAGFHDWLRARYGTVDTLNESWGTAFWSQTYENFAQVPLPELAPVPMPYGFMRESPSPSLALDYRRFVSDSHVRFLRLQVGELRPRVAAAQRITHNLMGFKFSEIDYHVLAAELDVVSWDNYPALDPSGRWAGPALAADAMRGLKDAPFWVLEQQVGPLGWEVLRTPRRGQMRLHAYQAIAHGAELVSFFRWRTARYGTEQHWYGVLDAHGRPGRRHREVGELGHELARLGDVLDGAVPVAGTAVLHDYDSRFALQVQPTNPSLAYEESIQRHYEAFRQLGIGVDIVSPAAGLARYRLVAAPNLYVVDEALAATLHAYVSGGGTLVLAPRAGVKDRCNVVPERPFPTLLAELAGVEVVDVASLLDESEVAFAGVDGVPRGTFAGWYEQIEPAGGARVLALYDGGDFAETPAITSHAVGEGRVLYLAGAADTATLRALYAAVAGEAGLVTAELPEGVECVQLDRAGEALLVLLNHTDAEREVVLDRSRLDLVSDREHERTIRLSPFGVAVLAPVRSAVETA